MRRPNLMELHEEALSDGLMELQEEALSQGAA